LPYLRLVPHHHLGGAKLHGSDAAIDVLLPLIAVSFELTAIGIVFVIVRAFAA